MPHLRAYGSRCNRRLPLPLSASSSPSSSSWCCLALPVAAASKPPYASPSRAADAANAAAVGAVGVDRPAPIPIPAFERLPVPVTPMLPPPGTKGGAADESGLDGDEEGDAVDADAETGDRSEAAGLSEDEGMSGASAPAPNRLPPPLPSPPIGASGASAPRPGLRLMQRIGERAEDANQLSKVRKEMQQIEIR